MTEDRHITLAECRRRLAPDEVALRSVVKDGICPAVRFEGTVTAHGYRKSYGRLEGIEEPVRQKYLFVSILVNVSQPEGFVLHLRQHPRFVGRVN